MIRKTLAIASIFSILIIAGCAQYGQISGPTNSPEPVKNVSTFTTKEACEATGCKCVFYACDFIPAGKTYKDVCPNGEYWQCDKPTTPIPTSIDAGKECTDRNECVYGCIPMDPNCNENCKGKCSEKIRCDEFIDLDNGKPMNWSMVCGYLYPQ